MRYEYELKPGPEAGWAGVIIALSVLVGAVLSAANVDAEIVTAAVGLIAALARPLIGLLLPSPS